MFKKKPTIKPLAPLRSSDRRKICDQIIKEFNIEVPQQEDKPQAGEVAQGAEPALTLSSIRNSLLPDNALSARFTTTHGPDLKQVSGTVYAGAHPEDDQRILWFSVDDRLIPTVYTLWRHPRLVPLLHTQDFVIERLQGGSPLMTPGLARGPPFPAGAKKGAIVAIASTRHPSVPQVVGVCEIDVSSLQKVQGERGHAVRSEQWKGDELWSWSTGGKPGGLAPNHIDGWDPEDESKDLESAAAGLVLEDEEDQGAEGGGVSLPNGKPTKQHNVHVDGGDAEPFERVEEKEMTTEEIDHVFWQAFLYGVQTARNKNKEDKNHGLSFPIPQSLVISNLVLPYLPMHTPSEAMSIKKTSWKNAKKFIKALHKAKLLMSKDRDGGECVVLDIDFEDPAVLSFVPYRLPKKESKGVESSTNGTGNANSSDASIGQTLKIINLYRPKDSLSPLFSASNASTKTLYLPTELRPIITQYIESERLVSATNKRLVNLNPILANAVFDGGTQLDKEVIAKGSVPRDALIDRILHSCSPFYALLRNDETRDTVKARAGHAPKIQVLLETRSDNKIVTKTSGVEVFYVNPHALADELQKSCASSTSVGQLAGSSPKTPVMEILVQGPQKDPVIKALEKRGVRKEWVEVVDKTKGKKKS